MVAWITTLTLPEVIGIIFGALVVAAVAIETRLLIETMLQIGQLTTRLEMVETAPGPNSAPDGPGLPEDSDAPAFELPDLFGEQVSLATLLEREKPITLVFTDPNCGPCQAMLPDLSQWVRDHQPRHSRGKSH